MRSIGLIAGLLCVISGGLNAQHPFQHKKRMVWREMAIRYNLTPEQLKNIREVIKEFRMNRRQEIRNAGGISPEVLAKINELKRNAAEKIYSILTEEQKKAIIIDVLDRASRRRPLPPMNR